MAGADERNSAFDEGDSSQVLPKSPGEWPVAVPVLIGEVIPDYPPQVEVKPPIPPFPLPNGVGLRVLGRIIAFDAPGHLYVFVSFLFLFSVFAREKQSDSLLQP